MNELTVFERRGQLVADSREVAEMIGRPHWQLLRTIDTMAKHLKAAGGDHKIVVSDFFIPTTYLSEQGKKMPCYLLTRLGCDMVANKQTGERGTLFTAAYVTRFRQMEQLLMEKQGQVWQDIRMLGKEIRRTETDAIKAFVEYATAQGSHNASRYYITLSRLADQTAGVVDRDNSTAEQLHRLLLVERIIAKTISEGIDKELPYKALYTACRERLEQFGTLALSVGA